MMSSTLKFCKIREVKSPVRGTPVAAGIDFFVPEDLTEEVMQQKFNITKCKPSAVVYNEHGNLTKIVLKPGQSVMIPSGIKLNIPHGYALAFMNKSGIGAKKQLDRLAELVDEDYQGEVHINVVNNGCSNQEIDAGDKIIQGVLIPVSYAVPKEISTVDELYKDMKSDRGTGGFGSTGTK